MDPNGGADDVAARRVLVVDDEQDIRDLVTIWLKDDPRCATVAEADDIDTAVQVALAASFDVVLLDFFLGARLSVEILPDLRRALPDALIVIYTASRLAATQAGAVSAGADLILEKANVAIDHVIDVLLSAVPDPPRPRRTVDP